MARKKPRSVSKIMVPAPSVGGPNRYVVVADGFETDEDALAYGEDVAAQQEAGWLLVLAGQRVDVELAQFVRVDYLTKYPYYRTYQPHGAAILRHARMPLPEEGSVSVHRYTTARGRKLRQKHAPAVKRQQVAVLSSLVPGMGRAVSRLPRR